MPPKTTLRELLKKKQVFAPAIWDCMSARAAEICGFDAMVLASSVFAWSHAGIPDFGLLTLDEVAGAAERITAACSLPLVIDGEDGFGSTPLHVYRSCKRLVQAGVQGIMIDDQPPIRGGERAYIMGEPGGPRPNPEWFTNKPPRVSTEVYLERIKAAVDATKGTDCLIIARTRVCGKGESFDESLYRAKKAMELGAEMAQIGIQYWQDTYPICKKINDVIPGWKVYGDLYSKDGVPDISMDDLKSLGFNFVGIHCFSYGAFYGMVDFGKHNVQNRSSVYSDSHPRGGKWLEDEVRLMEDYYSKSWLGEEKIIKETAKQAAEEIEKGIFR
ncbi:MAG: isocitrate lyase/PEP mutase family protein [Spirochaetales bacterium]|nr:isocitrate lyase/PEP mutase family protein [Spirochaetales bacterium]